MNWIVTGGAGFIGSNFIFYMMERYPDDRIICLDKLTYAGNLSTLSSVMDRPDLYFTEDTPLHTSSPYSSSKAAADLLVMSYYRTYGLPVSISRCSNNYGPYHFPEKLIPLMIVNALHDRPLPVYGQGIIGSRRFCLIKAARKEQ